MSPCHAPSPRRPFQGKRSNTAVVCARLSGFKSHLQQLAVLLLANLPTQNLFRVREGDSGNSCVCVFVRKLDELILIYVRDRTRLALPQDSRLPGRGTCHVVENRNLGVGRVAWGISNSTDGFEPFAMSCSLVG